ncbi:MAG: hypothetical protein CSA04_05500 [Bacteroidetes bacterium]|nr:MAG: hypothetical protein CSA04_05500 [Bacteroidota bacterium]
MAFLKQFAILGFCILLFGGGSTAYGQEKPVKKTITGSQIYKPYNPPAPSKNPNQLNLGLQYYREQAYEKSATVFEELYEKTPNHTHYTYYLYSLIGLRDYKKAERLIKKQRKHHPDKERYLIDLGYLYVTRGETQKGHKVYRKAIDQVAPNKRAIKNLANAFVGKREDELALATYERGKTLLEGSYGFEEELASLYGKMQQYEKMITTYLALAANDLSKVKHVQGRLQYYLSMDSEGALRKALHTQLIKQIQHEPNNRFYGDFLIWLSLQEKDFEMAFTQAKALDKRIDKTGDEVFNVAVLSSKALQFEVAEKAFEYLLSRYKGEAIYPLSLSGYTHARFINFKQIATPDHNEIRAIKTQLEKATSTLGVQPLSAVNFRDLAEFYAYYDHHTEEGISLLDSLLKIPALSPSIKHEIKLDLANLYLYAGDPWEATLLLSQVEKENKNEPIGHEAKLRNARLSYYIGEYGWAEGQLNILKAATSKLIANDAMNLYLFIHDHKGTDSLSPILDAFASTELLIFRREYARAEKRLDSLYRHAPSQDLTDYILFKQGEVATLTQQDARADSLYEQLYTLFPESLLADDALIKQIAIAKRAADEQRVAALNKKILFDYPASIFAIEARENFRSYMQKQEEEKYVPLPHTKQ